jgi:hypothetical protein
VQGHRRAGERDAVRQGGQRGAAEACPGKEPEGLRVRRGPVRQMRRRHLLRRRIRAGKIAQFGLTGTSCR